MPKRITMPKLSEMEEGALIAWRKRPGDTIRRGEILAEIETDKADMEFESYAEGTIHSLLIEPGATVPVGTLIAVIQLPGESENDVQGALSTHEEPVAAAPAPRAAAAPAAAPASAAPIAAASAPRARPSAPVYAQTAPAPAATASLAGPRIAPLAFDDDRIRATPRARRLADDKSIDLLEIEGSGPGGSILVSDIETYLRELDSQTEDPEGIRATPLAFRVAEDLGVDLEHLKGTGPGGRITKSDVVSHQKIGSARAKDHEAELYSSVLQLSQKRKTLIRNVIKSKQEAPYFYLQMDVSTDALRVMRDRLNRESGDSQPRLSYTHLILKASAMALEKYPEANATYRPEERDIAVYEAINVGLAVDVNDELVTPTVKNCHGRSVFQLAEDANHLIQRARMRKLQPQDYAEGTFTISNLGMFGIDRFYAIITPPQSSILAVSAMKDVAIVRNGELAVGSITNLGLSVDHRVLDGVKASLFLGEIKRLLENPEELLKDGASFGS